ncbi:MAG TPA: cytochrome c [Vicinamibacterales bacterium]|nr:cytochrome c [Vicinamibacterales bacterium]
MHQLMARARFNASSRHALLIVALVVMWDGQAQTQTRRTVQEGVYSTAQAERGQALYAKRCASCHGNMLSGGQAPPLVGDVFVSNWRTEPLSTLVTKIRNTMPADKPGDLTAAQSVDLVALILKTGGFRAGATELASTDEALNAIGWPSKPADASAATAQARAYPPLGNMAQLMRGIFFPNSNLIFTVQTHDPGAPAPPPSTSTQSAGFSFVDWGAGIYGGWQLVDNAAIALADASPLMLTPGIRCENGRLAPVTDPDWIKFTEQLIAVSKKTYRASQSRSQDAVSEATGDLSDACAACHQAYRDIRGRGATLDPTDPSNKASRCQSRVKR